jgi:hypothetical protein
MKKIYSHFTGLAVFIILLVSCKKEGDQYYIKQGSFPVAGLTASSDNVILTSAKESDTAITFNWPAADFGQKPVVAYTLQIDVPSDTSGTNPWANAKNFTVGNDLLTYGFITKDLNSLLIGMALPGGTSSKIVVRIKSDVPQYNGSASSIASAYSNTITIQVTPYNIILYIPGDYQGWDPATAPMLNPVSGRAGLYEAYEYMPGSGIHYFKYINSPDWNHTNYGDGGNGTFSTYGAAAGLNVPDGGYYELTANLNNNTWTATKTTWGIIGDATPGAWDTDTQMSYDATNQVWKVTVNMKASGSFKFRANNAWVIDFGVDANGNLAYADNPFFGYNSTLNNLTVPTDGNYTITLDLHTSGKYLYTIVKN